MWFKNIHFYKFDGAFRLTAQQLQEALQTRESRGCGQMELTASGWCSPVGQPHSALVHQTNGQLMIAMRREDKILPASLVREEVELRAQAFEQEHGWAAGRKERRDFKEQVLQALLPKAFVKSNCTHAAIFPESGWFVINSSSAKRADEVIALLRKTLAAFNVVVPTTDLSLEDSMTRWLLDDEALPAGFTLEDACELRASNERQGVIRCSGVEVTTGEVRAHIPAGYRVNKLALNWQERLSFVLHDDLSVHRMRFDSVVTDAAEAGDDPLSQFDADFAIMAGELIAFIPALLGAVKAKV